MFPVPALGVAKLDNANLHSADLGGAILINTSFINADLSYANFKFSNMFGLKNEGNLELATIMMVDFTNANLINALIDTEQLMGATSLNGATMPNGQSYDDWIKTQPNTQ